MRKLLKYYNGLVKDKSVVRYDDLLYLFHGAYVHPKTGKIKLVVSNIDNGKMRFIHDRDRKKVYLEYTLK